MINSKTSCCWLPSSRGSQHLWALCNNDDQDGDVDADADVDDDYDDDDDNNASFGDDDGNADDGADADAAAADDDDDGDGNVVNTRKVLIIGSVKALSQIAKASLAKKSMRWSKQNININTWYECLANLSS